ncbi:MAG: hypothetical protein K0R84_325 [Clostridia bacterium]|jgi:hypothetical protein|nr:hypothetical protein [Clostridia bacterium]
MKKSQKDDKSKKDDYIEKIQEWQEHQYDPGYYIGGNIPPVITHTGRPKLLGWFWVISAIVSAIIVGVMLKAVYEAEEIVSILIIAVPLYVLIIFYFIAGIRLIKKGAAESYTRAKMFLIKVCCGIAVV